MSGPFRPPVRVRVRATGEGGPSVPKWRRPGMGAPVFVVPVDLRTPRKPRHELLLAAAAVGGFAAGVVAGLQL